MMLIDLMEEEEKPNFTEEITVGEEEDYILWREENQVPEQQQTIIFHAFLTKYIDYSCLGREKNKDSAEDSG